MGINGCSSSSELDARYVQPPQKTTKRKTSPHLESVYLPFMLCVVAKAWASAKQEGF